MVRLVYILMIDEKQTRGEKEEERKRQRHRDREI